MPRTFEIVVGVVAALALAGAARAETGLDDGLHRAFLISAPTAERAPAPRWTTMLARMAAETPLVCTASDKLADGACRFDAWRRQLVKLDAKPPRRQLKEVNRRINALTYVSDVVNWGQADHWETPREMFERGGDCEGFALTKYFALRQLDFSEQDLRIAVIWDRIDQEQHAILLVRVNEDVLVLDNKRTEVISADLLSDRYRLLFYLNEGEIALPVSTPRQTTRRTPARAQIINGGRTLALRIQPRRERETLLLPARTFALALAETTAPAGE